MNMSDDRPNVLWICTDSQRWDTLGCYGNDHVSTPNIDALADNGVRFDRAYCNNPICCPSRASFLTGRYPQATGVNRGGQPIPEDERLITQTFAEADYHCGLAGKLHISPINPYDGIPRSEAEPLRRVDDGYAEFLYSASPGGNYPGDQYRRYLREKGLEFETERVEGSGHVSTSLPYEHHQTGWGARKAAGFIEDADDGDQPWLFSLNLFDPHHPFDPPPEYLEPYLNDLESIPPPNYEEGELADKPVHQQHLRETAYVGNAEEFDEREHRLFRAAYFAMCDAIDDAVGELLDALERTGQREDTLVVFTSDHGELLGDHGMYLKGPSFYEPSMRVPLVVSGPGTESGVESDALVELLDLAPTLLDAAGLEHEPGMQGRSLWPLLTGERDSDDHRKDVYATRLGLVTDREEIPDVIDEAVTDRSRANVRACNQISMLRTDRYKLVRWHNVDGGELYDLKRDPTETHNLWDDSEYVDIRADLLARLSDRSAWANDPLPEVIGRW